jgi:hypothetical protein
MAAEPALLARTRQENRSLSVNSLSTNQGARAEFARPQFSPGGRRRRTDRRLSRGVRAVMAPGEEVAALKRSLDRPRRLGLSATERHARTQAELGTATAGRAACVCCSDRHASPSPARAAAGGPTGGMEPKRLPLAGRQPYGQLEAWHDRARTEKKCERPESGARHHNERPPVGGR